MLTKILEELVGDALIRGQKLHDIREDNQAIAHAKSEIEKLVMSEEEIKKILCVACGDCTDHPADCMMVCNQATAIRAEQLKRMEMNKLEQK